MPIINQPFQGQLGEILINELEKNYSSFTILSAFAKNSGILRLKKSLENHKTNGGTITAFIGIDLEGTSYEALLNLYSICDNLYVVHSEMIMTTYHSKIYLLENKDSAWCAIGSNNLTVGGLWTNFESCYINNYSSSKEKSEIESIHEIIEKYSDPAYECSYKITSISDINELMEAGYISKEIPLRIESIKKHIAKKASKKKLSIFGKEKVSAPRILSITKNISESSTSSPSEIDYHIEIPVEELPLDFHVFTNEHFWFEMRESTGGSRNILDLSKLGKIASGTVIGTPYEYPTNPTMMYGGVKFFEIDPEDTTREKDITINYLGKDYFPSTIKFTPNNGSWRIQLKGEPNDGSEELSKFGNHGDFVHKILVFEKINPDYYVLSLVNEGELPRMKALSRVWARNGRNNTSKAYGML